MRKYSLNPPASSKYGSSVVAGQKYSGLPTATYHSTLSVQYADGSNMKYEQSLSVPMYPGSSLSFSSRIPYSGDTVGRGKSISDLVKPYSSPAAGKNTYSKNPAGRTGYGRKIGTYRPACNGQNFGTDGASHLFGYSHLSEMLTDEAIRKLYESSKDSYMQKEKEEQKYKESCIKCGRPATIDNLCDYCFANQMNETGGKENGEDYRNRFRYI